MSRVNNVDNNYVNNSLSDPIQTAKYVIVFLSIFCIIIFPPIPLINKLLPYLSQSTYHQEADHIRDNIPNNIEINNKIEHDKISDKDSIINTILPALNNNKLEIINIIDDRVSIITTQAKENADKMLSEFENLKNKINEMEIKKHIEDTVENIVKRKLDEMKTELLNEFELKFSKLYEIININVNSSRTDDLSVSSLLNRLKFW